MKKHIKVLLLSSIVFSLAIFVASKLSIASNMEDMLGEDNKTVQTSDEFEQFFTSQDQVIIVLEKKDSSSHIAFDEEAKQYMSMLSNNLSEKDFIDTVYYRFDLTAVEAYAWAYLDMSYYDQIQEALQENDMVTIMSILQEVENLEHKDYEYLVNDNHEYYLMIIKPLLVDEDFMKAREVFYDGVNQAIDTVYDQLEISTFTVGLTGGGFIQDLESDAVAFDGLFSTFVITILIVIGILVLFLRTLKLPLLAVYPLLFGAVLASAIAYMLYGSLNMFAVSFALLLIGLGIDFAVHIISRYQEERYFGSSTELAVKNSIKHTGMSIIFGAMTTAFAFVSFVVAEFKAFEQMGVIAAIGIIELCIIMLIVMPALILTFDRKEYSKKGFVSLPLLDSFLQRLFRYRWALFGFVFAIIGVLAMQVQNVSLRTEMDAIYPDNIPSNQYIEIIETEFEMSTDSISTYVSSLEKLEQSESVLEQETSILYVETVLDFMPQQQEDKLAILLQLDEYLQSLNISVFSEYNLSLMTIHDLPQKVQDNFIGKEDTYRIDIIPRIDIYNIEAYNELEQAVVSATTNYPVGLPVIMNQVTQMVQKDIMIISIICISVVILMILILFRSLSALVITITPLILTLYTTITLLPILGVDMNVFSIAAFPLIIGIGIDSAIHLYHRYTEDSSQSITKRTSLLAKAILLTSLTTIVGFGSLSMINHPGMSNLGLTVAIGIAISFIYTITLVPTLSNMFQKTPSSSTTW